MRLKNGIVLDQDFILSPKDIEVQGEWITALTPWRDEEPGGWIDLSNKLVIPGLIDQHIHGCGGFDVEDASLEALAAMSEELARHGVTSFCPTVMARPIEELPPILDMIRAGQRQGLPGAYVHGARLEGPYLSPLKKGAQKESRLSKPDAGEFLALWNRYSGLIKIVDLAPELEGAEDFIRRVRSRCVISMAHTAASYEGALEAFRQGVGQATHLFNGMAALGHREPGPAGAVLDSEQVRAELICDGIHIHPAMLRLAFRILGSRAVVVSDSMRAAGMPDGEYTLGGQKVCVRRGAALLRDGTSTTNHQACEICGFGIPLAQAVKAMTLNPAVQLGADKTTGSIQPGKYADLVVLDQDYEIFMVLVKGKIRWCGNRAPAECP
ncbi:MAG: N-acetylglucosamine-6-phosphate deacetylase [[Clostridium] leptum]